MKWPNSENSRGPASPGRGGNHPYPPIFQPSPFTDENRRKRAKDRRRRHFAGWPSRLLLLFALLLSAAVLVAFLPQFYIENVTVTGCRMTDQAAIKAFAKTREGHHFLEKLGGSPSRFLSLRYGSIEDDILAAYPVIRQVKVRFRFPSVVAVIVEEKVEVLAVRISGGYALIDRQHEVLRIAEDADFALPVLEGIAVTGQTVRGEPLPVEDPGQLSAASHLIAGLIRHDEAGGTGPGLMAKVRQIRQLGGKLFVLFIPLSQGGEIRVRLEDNRQLQEKLALLDYLLEREDIIPQAGGELDLSGETAYFRPDAGGGHAVDYTVP
ncbi:MAG TPA: FtsQ-type POTRA domain-containing protein [Bacillota bacterium]|jgi:cell division septal protein FtsQ|nr:FtsQ-type POTRA domain-containing protein [Fastidiosipila sp.]HPX92914.1 FtsQ-type POTRA domain-containing protein [Bacillota bacterium]HQB80696.1 FtsQ-type POTRA domain-containing protein [Bacillota bacterium]